MNCKTIVMNTPPSAPATSPRTFVGSSLTTGGASSSDLRALAAGEAETWAAVITRFRPLVASRARRHRLNPEQAADVHQQIWLRLYENAGKLRDPERLAGWLATTADREALKTQQRFWREPPHPDTAVDRSTEVDYDEPLDAAERAKALHAAVAQLPDRERRLIQVMLEPDLPSYTEISRRLQMPVGSIGPVRARALARLRRYLQNAAPHVDRTARGEGPATAS